VHPDLHAAREAVRRLSHALDTEFAALKAKDAEQVEALQTEKTAALDQLAQLVHNRRADGALDADWQALIEQVGGCQEAHRRNEYLARCQLEAVQNTLGALHAESGGSGVDLYDRLGQVARKLGARGYGAF
jgi:flagellar biosynthesis/type III secretory pathway chaperone